MLRGKGERFNWQRLKAGIPRKKNSRELSCLKLTLVPGIWLWVLPHQSCPKPLPCISTCLGAWEAPGLPHPGMSTEKQSVPPGFKSYLRFSIAPHLNCNNAGHLLGPSKPLMMGKMHAGLHVQAQTLWGHSKTTPEHGAFWIWSLSCSAWQRGLLHWGFSQKGYSCPKSPMHYPGTKPHTNWAPEDTELTAHFPEPSGSVSQANKKNNGSSGKNIIRLTKHTLGFWFCFRYRSYQRSSTLCFYNFLSKIGRKL